MSYPPGDGTRTFTVPSLSVALDQVCPESSVTVTRMPRWGGCATHSWRDPRAHTDPRPVMPISGPLASAASRRDQKEPHGDVADGNRPHLT
jgi:hypothetical protein